MTTKIKMWGNSLGVRIPKYISDELSLKAGSEVQLSLEDQKISIRPLKSKKTPSLKELISRITDENRHGDVWEGWVGPVGKEIW